MKKVLIILSDDDALTRIAKELRNYPSLEPTYIKTFKEAMELLKDKQEIFHAAVASLKLSDASNGEIVQLLNMSKLSSVVVSEKLNGAKKAKIIGKNILDLILDDAPNSVSLTVQALHKITTNYDKTVLVVDDTKSYRNAVRVSLEEEHFNVLEASNGEEALSILKDNLSINLVITDNEMPVMDGLDLTYNLRNIYNKDELSIIVISTIEDKESISKFLKLGANDYLNKPFSHEEIMIRVNANLDLLELFSSMKDLANRDFLSGMYNRRYFFDSAEAIYAKNKRKKQALCVAMIDIDDFKKINDTYGHDIGDMAIKAVTVILNGICRSSDLIARFGGEEFCILLEEITAADTEKLFEKIRKAFEGNVIKADDTELSYTVSIGISYGFSDSLDAMIKESDEALYEAKTTGKNRVCYHDY